MWQIFQQLEAAQAIAADLKTHRPNLLAQIQQQNSPFQHLLTIISYDINQAKAFINLLSHLVNDPQLLVNQAIDQEIKFYQPNPTTPDANKATFENSYYQINLCNLQPIDNFIFIDHTNLNPLLETLKTNPQLQIYLGFLTFSDVQLYQIKAQHHHDKITLAKQWLNHIASKYEQQAKQQQNPQWIHYCNQIVTNLEIYCWLSKHQLMLNQIKNHLLSPLQVQPPNVQPEGQQTNLNSKQIVYDDQF